MSRWPTWFAAASLVLAVFTGLDYSGPALRGGLAATLLFALVFLSAAGSGRVLVALLGLSDISESQRTLIGSTLGLGLLSFGTFALGVTGLLNSWAVSLLLGVLWLVGFTELRDMAGSLESNLRLLSVRPAAALGILSLLAVLFWTTWVPPHQYDSLVYHLALPAAYIRAGRITGVDQLLFSHFPQNGEMLFTLALLLKSDLLAQMLVWSCSALSVWWVFETGKREAPLSAVLLGCGLLATHTAVMLLSGTTYVEPVVMLWVSASVLSFYRWRGMSSGQPGQRSWLLLSAVFCGLALGTKYSAGIAAGLLGVFLLLRLLFSAPQDRRGRGFELLLFTGVTTLLFLPWLVKNVVFIGNPVFPFLYTWFPNTGTGWNGEAARDYFNVMTEYGHGGRFWQDLIRLPFLLLGNSQRFGGGMDVLGNFGWEVSFLSLPLAVWAGRGNKFLRGLLVFFFCYMAVWFSTGVVLRFLTAVAPLLCLLAGVGLHALWGRLGTAGRVLLAGALMLFTAVHLLLFGFVHSIFASGAVLFGLEDRQTFLAKRLDYYPCAAWAGEHLGKNDKLLLVGEQRGYYVDRGHVASTVNAPNLFLAWAGEAKDPAALADRLRGEGFTHLLLVPREAKRLGSGLRPFSEAAERNLSGLEPGRLSAVFRGPACQVYALSGGR